MDRVSTTGGIRLRATAAFDVGRSVAEGWRRERVSGLSAEIAFFWVLSLFPALLALAAALGSLDALAGSDLAERAKAEVLGFLRDTLTEEASGTVDAVEEVFSGSSPGVLTVGAAVAVWSASRGFNALIRTLDLVYGLKERRGYLATRALALALAVGSVVVMASTLAMLVLGPLLGTGGEVADAVGLGSAFATWWELARWPTAAVVLVAWSTTVFHLGPNHRTPWRWDLPGAVLTAVAWALASLGLRAYLALAGGGNQVFGALGGALIVLLWLYLLAMGLLLGGLLNAVLARRHAPPGTAAPG
ncbi:MAG: YihY/virulence factor BrkB family protein [Acidimicrobiia bacterium]